MPVPMLFEHHESDAYHLEGKTSAVTAPVADKVGTPATVRLLLERRESDAYHLEERVLAAAPAVLEEVQTVAITRPPMSEVAEPPVSVVPVEIPAEPATLTQVQFRQALIEVDDPDAFWDGVVGGQVAVVEEEGPLTGELIFASFEDAVDDLQFSETWLAGYLLGLSDAWLRRRKVYPPAYTASLQPRKKGRFR